MADSERTQEHGEQIQALTQELDQAELFVQRLSRYIGEVRDQLAAGHAGRALSICNQALTEIDNQTDVVAPSPRLKESAGLDADHPRDDRQP